MPETRLSGTVKSFDTAKGYGYIDANGYPRPIFVYYASITGDHYRSLKTGEPVEFSVIETPQGPRALEVTKR